LIVGLVWAGWWTFFILSSVFSDAADSMLPEAIRASVILIVLVLIIWASLAIAWKRPFIGGIVLIFEGLFTAVVYPIMASGNIEAGVTVLMLLILSLPPLAAGVLFLLSLREGQRHPKEVAD